MRGRAALGLVAALSFSGCTERHPSTTTPLTPSDSLLADALVTLELAAARTATSVAPKDALLDAYAVVLDETGLDSARIASNLSDLAAEPERASAVFALAADRLQQEQRGLRP